MKKQFLVLWVVMIVFLSNGIITGQGWIQQNSGTSNMLPYIYFINSETGWAAGWGGTLLKTVNGGTNWVQQVTGTTAGLQCVYFVDENTGWFFGQSGTIAKSTNGGINWVNQSSNTSVILLFARFINANTGYVVGYGGKILKTTNGGGTWVSKLFGFTTNIVGISTPSPETAYVSGDGGLFLKTTDSGETWMILNSGVTSTLSSLWFIDNNTGYIPGDNGLVLKTTNGGTNFIILSSGTTSKLQNAHFENANTGWISGFGGTIIKTINGGQSFTVQTTNISSSLNCNWFVNANTGYASGDNGKIIKTTTGGENTIPPVVPVLISPANNSILTILNPQLVWQSVPNSTFYRVQVSKTSNFAVITDSITTVNVNHTIPNGKLQFNFTYFWRVRAGNQYGTSNWTSPWSFSTSGVPSAPTLISPINGAVNQPYRPLLLWDSMPGIANYKVQISTVPTFSIITDSITTVNSRYLIPNGKLNNNTTYFWRVNANNQYGASQWSAVWNFAVNVTGITTLTNLIPVSNMLYNNYPNPFNPVTKIRFDIAHPTNAKISIYDISGRILDVFMNGNLNAGCYEITWNASKYSSGIYILRIEAKDFSATKRLVLLK